MKIITIANQKGGVAKTLTSINMSYVLSAHHNKRVLLVDADEQGNATKFFDRYGYEKPSIAEILTQKKSIGEVIQPTKYQRLDIVPANLNMVKAINDVLTDANGAPQQIRLREALRNVKDDYDYVIIDNAPNLNMGVINALATSDYMIVPVKIDKFTFDGVDAVLQQAEQIKRYYNSQLRFLGCLVTSYRRNDTNRQGLEWLRQNKKYKVEVNIATVLEEKIPGVHILNYKTTVSYKCQSGSHIGGCRPVGHFDTIPAARAAAIAAAADTCKEVAEGLLAGGYIDTLPEKFGPPKWKKTEDGQWVFDTHRWFIIKAAITKGMIEGLLSATYAVVKKYPAYKEEKEPTWYVIKQDYENEEMALQGVLEHTACMGTEYATVLKEYVGGIPEEAKQADREAAKRREDAMPKSPKQRGERYEACSKKMKEEGWGSLEPCEQCMISTCCEKCCKTCNEKCNAGQECRLDKKAAFKKKAFAASVVRNDLVSRRDMHIGLADVDVSEGNTDGAENEKNIIEYYDKLIERVENDVDYYQGV